MLLIKLLILCEQSKDASSISFRTKNFQGDLVVEGGNVIKVAGLDPTNLKKALFEEALELFMKKTPSGPVAETRLAINTLTMETAAYLHENHGIGTSFSSLQKSPDQTGFMKNFSEEKSSFFSESIPEKKNSKEEPNDFDLRKTINVDAIQRVAKASTDKQQNKLPHIMLPFVLGIPEKKVMGRSKDCDIVVESDDVSRRHCELTFSGKNLTVKDLGSSNGTYLNGRVVIESGASNNDILHLGSTAYMIVIE